VCKAPTIVNWYQARCFPSVQYMLSQCDHPCDEDVIPTQFGGLITREDDYTEALA